VLNTVASLKVPKQRPVPCWYSVPPSLPVSFCLLFIAFLYAQPSDALAAVKRGAMERLIPILMTALAAGLALVPLALSAGDIIRPAEFDGT